MILIIDNYDSFVHNLARYVRQLCRHEVSVVRNDQLEIDSWQRTKISALIISPGPCGPAQAGQCLSFVREWMNDVPTLGVCLGHQIIVQSLGGTIGLSSQPMHGKTCMIYHGENSRLFDQMPSPFVAGRYHSLVANPDSIPASLKVSANTEDNIVMAVEHEFLPVFGVQFHPESVLTEYGYRLLYNFLAIADLDPVLPDKQRIFT